MKIAHQAMIVVNQENGQVFTDLRGYGPLWGSKCGDISLDCQWDNLVSTFPSPTLAHRQNGVGDPLDLGWSCVDVVLQLV